MPGWKALYLLLISVGAGHLITAITDTKSNGGNREPLQLRTGAISCNSTNNSGHVTSATVAPSGTVFEGEATRSPQADVNLSSLAVLGTHDHESIVGESQHANNHTYQHNYVHNGTRGSKRRKCVKTRKHTNKRGQEEPTSSHSLNTGPTVPVKTEGKDGQNVSIVIATEPVELTTAQSERQSLKTTSVPPDDDTTIIETSPREPDNDIDYREKNHSSTSNTPDTVDRGRHSSPQDPNSTDVSEALSTKATESTLATTTVPCVTVQGSTNQTSANGKKETHSVANGDPSEAFVKTNVSDEIKNGSIHQNVSTGDIITPEISSVSVNTSLEKTDVTQSSAKGSSQSLNATDFPYETTEKRDVAYTKGNETDGLPSAPTITISEDSKFTQQPEATPTEINAETTVETTAPAETPPKREEKLESNNHSNPTTSENKNPDSKNTLTVAEESPGNTQNASPVQPGLVEKNTKENRDFTTDITGTAWPEEISHSNKTSQLNGQDGETKTPPPQATPTTREPPTEMPLSSPSKKFDDTQRQATPSPSNEISLSSEATPSQDEEMTPTAPAGTPKEIEPEEGKAPFATPIANDGPISGGEQETTSLTTTSNTETYSGATETIPGTLPTSDHTGNNNLTNGAEEGLHSITNQSQSRNASQDVNTSAEPTVNDTGNPHPSYEAETEKPSDTLLEEIPPANSQPPQGNASAEPIDELSSADQEDVTTSTLAGSPKDTFPSTASDVNTSAQGTANGTRIPNPSEATNGETSPKTQEGEHIRASTHPKSENASPEPNHESNSPNQDDVTTTTLAGPPKDISLSTAPEVNTSAEGTINGTGIPNPSEEKHTDTIPNTPEGELPLASSKPQSDNASAEAIDESISPNQDDVPTSTLAGPPKDSSLSAAPEVNTTAEGTVNGTGIPKQSEEKDIETSTNTPKGELPLGSSKPQPKNASAEPIDEPSSANQDNVTNSTLAGPPNDTSPSTVPEVNTPAEETVNGTGMSKQREEKDSETSTNTPDGEIPPASAKPQPENASAERIDESSSPNQDNATASTLAGLPKDTPLLTAPDVNTTPEGTVNGTGIPKQSKEKDIQTSTNSPKGELPLGSSKIQPENASAEPIDESSSPNQDDVTTSTLAGPPKDSSLSAAPEVNTTAEGTVNGTGIPKQSEEKDVETSTNTPKGEQPLGSSKLQPKNASAEPIDESSSPNQDDVTTSTLAGPSKDTSPSTALEVNTTAEGTANGPGIPKQNEEKDIETSTNTPKGELPLGSSNPQPENASAEPIDESSSPNQDNATASTLAGLPKDTPLLTAPEVNTTAEGTVNGTGTLKQSEEKDIETSTNTPKGELPLGSSKPQPENASAEPIDESSSPNQDNPTASTLAGLPKDTPLLTAPEVNPSAERSVNGTGIPNPIEEKDSETSANKPEWEVPGAISQPQSDNSSAALTEPTHESSSPNQDNVTTSTLAAPITGPPKDSSLSAAPEVDTTAEGTVNGTGIPKQSEEKDIETSTNTPKGELPLGSSKPQRENASVEPIDESSSPNQDDVTTSTLAGPPKDTSLSTAPEVNTTAEGTVNGTGIPKQSEEKDIGTSTNTPKGELPLGSSKPQRENASAEAIDESSSPNQDDITTSTLAGPTKDTSLSTAPDVNMSADVTVNGTGIPNPSEEKDIETSTNKPEVELPRASFQPQSDNASAEPIHESSSPNHDDVTTSTMAGTPQGTSLSTASGVNTSSEGTVNGTGILNPREEKDSETSTKSPEEEAPRASSQSQSENASAGTTTPANTAAPEIAENTSDSTIPWRKICRRVVPPEPVKSCKFKCDYYTEENNFKQEKNGRMCILSSNNGSKKRKRFPDVNGKMGKCYKGRCRTFSEYDEKVAEENL